MLIQTLSQGKVTFSSGENQKGLKTLRCYWLVLAYSDFESGFDKKSQHVTIKNEVVIMKIQGEQPETTVVRLPKSIIADLKKLKLKKELPTVGAALQFWIQQQQNEQIEAKLEDIYKILSLQGHSQVILGALISTLVKEIGPEEITKDPNMREALEKAANFVENNKDTIQKTVGEWGNIETNFKKQGSSLKD